MLTLPFYLLEKRVLAMTCLMDYLVCNELSKRLALVYRNESLEN